MGDVAVPKVHGEAGVVATDDGDEVFLEGADGFLGTVGAVAIWRDQLKNFVGFGHEFLEPGWAFIVKDVEFRLEDARAEIFVQGGVAVHDLCFAMIFHGLGEYGVGVVLVEYHDVLVAFSGGGGETTGLVSGDFSAFFHGFHEDPIGSDAQLVGWGRRRHDGFNEVRGRWRGKFSGPDIFLVGSKMAFCGGKGLGEMIAHEFDSETRPSGNVPRLDSLCSSGDDQTSSAAMEVLDKVALGGNVVCIERNVARLVGGRGEGDLFGGR